MDFEIVKSGWLFRQSSILKRWKKCWFALYRDGYLKYYDKPWESVAEAAISIPTDCSDIISENVDVTPPSHLSKDCLLCVITMSGDTWILCAESPDDKKAWEMTLNDARLEPVFMPLPPPYSATQPPPYCTQVVQCDANSPYVNSPYVNGYQQHPGQTTVVYVDRPYYYRRDGTDLAMGMMTGAALGSLMWGPLLWW